MMSTRKTVIKRRILCDVDIAAFRHSKSALIPVCYMCALRAASSRLFK